MNLLSSWQHFYSRFYSRWVLSSIGLVLLCISLSSCSTPTQANSPQPTDPQLEAKVLQVIRNHPEVILESVQAYQQKQQAQQQQTQKAFIEGMKANPKSVIDESPATGAKTQNIVLLEFSDFQCPFCAKAHQSIKQFMASHGNQVTLVYKYLPLTRIHPEALASAKAAWAASQQGKFWEFHDALFENQNKLGESMYVETAKALNLDLNKFNQDRNSDAANAAIQKDVAVAEKLGVNGTPFLVMNGEPLNGAPQLPELEALLAQVTKK